MALTARRAWHNSSGDAPLLPQPAALAPLWMWGVKPRQGDFIMIAGRPGSQKSGFALFWTRQMGLPTLYFSGDSTPFEMTSRLVSMETGETIEQIEENLKISERAVRYDQALDDSNITFSFKSPITWEDIHEELDLWLELHNEYPKVIVVDNLMDIAGAETAYDIQSEVMQDATSLTRETGSTLILLHHATDKSERASSQPGRPPRRDEIKNGLAEKPQLTLTVQYAPPTVTEGRPEMRVACVKQRKGRDDRTAIEYVRLLAYPETTRFAPGPASWYQYITNNTI